MPKMARICTWSLCSSVELRILFQNGRSAFFSDLNKNLALCIDNNDNQMTFVGHIVYLCPSWHNLHPLSARAQMMLLGSQINYIPSKCHMIVLLLDPQLKTTLGLQDILQDLFVQQILMCK